MQKKLIKEQFRKNIFPVTNKLKIVKKYLKDRKKKLFQLLKTQIFMTVSQEII